MDELQLPAHLDGSQGSNRDRTGKNQLGADSDLGAIRSFLDEHADSPATHRSYKKEIERLVLWAVLQRGKALSSLDREDFAAYAEFLTDPRPQDRWCGPKRGRRGVRFSAGWRPFVGPLGPSARRTALVIVNAMMSYLVQARYLAGNPLALIRRRSRLTAAPRSTRRQVMQRSFDAVEWDALLDALEALPQGTSEERGTYERVRFLVALLYFLALRVGEVERHRMGDFVQVRGRWLFYVTGKGQKEAEIPVGEELLRALRQFRLHLGLPALPAPGDEMPLAPELGGKRPISARRINQLLKRLLGLAADQIEAREPDRAGRLRRASAHWFRHTALTHQAEKGIPLAHIKANARHAKLDTTMIYVHTDEDARHEEMKKHTWR